MTGDVIIDTNAVIDLFRGSELLLARFERVRSVYLPTVVFGELVYGAHKSKNIEANLVKINDFVRNTIMLSIDRETAIYYGEVKARLRVQGSPIPENDVWIASLALRHGLPLVSRDKHFRHVTGLRVLTW